MFNFKSLVISIFIMLVICGCTTLTYDKPDQLDLSELESAINDNQFPETTSLLILRNGNLIYEKYFLHGSAVLLNDTRSVTKSITGLIVGKAIADGYIKNTDEKLADFFGKDQIHRKYHSPIFDDIAIKDLLSMSSAFLANDIDDNSPGNENQMHEEQIWLDWGLNLPINEEYIRSDLGYGPFNYATINSFLLGQIIESSSKISIDKYIAESIFAPLNINEYEFQKSPSNEIMTGGGLRLTSRDLLKIGQLVLDKGRYDNNQVIPAEWIEESLQVRNIDPDSGAGYGYQFWNFNFPTPNMLKKRKLHGNKSKNSEAWMMLGNGGNQVVILENLNTVIVLTRQNYNSPSQAIESISLTSNYIIPALLGADKS